VPKVTDGRLAEGADTVPMETDRDSRELDAAGDAAGDGSDIEMWMDVNGVRVIPGTGAIVTAEMIRRMIDEDRERYGPGGVRKG